MSPVVTGKFRQKDNRTQKPWRVITKIWPWSHRAGAVERQEGTETRRLHDADTRPNGIFKKFRTGKFRIFLPLPMIEDGDTAAIGHCIRSARKNTRP